MSKNRGSRIFLLAWIATAIFAAIGVIILYLQPKEILSGLDPNEWGDYFAGIAGSLAFVWLVAGFYLQRVELKQNTKALEVQSGQLEVTANEAKINNELAVLTSVISHFEPQVGEFPKVNLQSSKYQMSTGQNFYKIVFTSKTYPSATSVVGIHSGEEESDVIEYAKAQKDMRDLSFTIELPKKKETARQQIKLIFKNEKGITKNITYVFGYDKDNTNFTYKTKTDEVSAIHRYYLGAVQRLEDLQKSQSPESVKIAEEISLDGISIDGGAAEK